MESKKAYINKFLQLSQVLIIVLTLSYRQIDGGRRFSSNAQILHINMKKVSMIFSNIIKKCLTKSHLEPNSIKIITKMKR